MSEHEKNLERRKNIAQKLKAKGKPVIVRRWVEGEYDPNIGQATNTQVDQRSYALEMDYNIVERANANIALNERKLMLSTEGINNPPEVGDEIILNAGKANESTARVVMSSPFEPATVTLYYDVSIAR